MKPAQQCAFFFLAHKHTKSKLEASPAAITLVNKNIQWNDQP